MKILLIIALFGLVASTAFANSRLNRDVVIELGKGILKLEKYRDFRDKFETGKPKFDSKEKVWRFTVNPKGFPVTPGGAALFFEIRDSDTYYRIGSVSSSGFDPKISKNFHLSPNARETIRVILEKYHFKSASAFSRK